MSNEIINGNNSPLAIRASAEWSKIAKQEVKVEHLSGELLYAFGSELACLRLEHTMRHGRTDYSKSRKSWYWCNEKF